MEYDYYNREERALCAHLFRLLHEWIAPDREGDEIVQFLERSGADVEDLDVRRIKIFTEVALIRDAYFIRKDDAEDFMDDLAREVADQENLIDYRLFSQLPQVLRDPSQTHPKQIRQKAASEGVDLTKEEGVLYGAVQAMFNAKPDLAITTQDQIVAYEAKYTEPFNLEQIRRTEKIAQVWSRLLSEDLGFAREPRVIVSKIGPSKFVPEISWEWLFDLAQKTYISDDRTYIAMSNAVRFLSERLAG